MLAFSYVRFSSAEQLKGDSLRRQTELAEKYATDHGLQLDSSLSFRDLGVSAFTGKNRTEGALSAFLQACRSGKVPKGSALLIESLDRLSREEVEEAMYQFLDIVRAGIEIHTLADGAVYKRGQLKTEQLMLSLFVMSRANEESATKSKRVRAAHAKSKASIAINPGVSVGGRVPAWVISRKSQPFELHPDRAPVVAKIFELCLSGLGDFLIAEHLNANYSKWSPGGFHHSYVQKVLTHPASYGAYRPHGGGDLVPGHYPAVVDFATFEKVRQLRASRNREKLGPSDPLMRNLFGGLVLDMTEGLSGINMVYHNKRSQLMTDSYRIGKRPNRIKYADFESAFLRFLDQLDYTTVLDVHESADLQETENELARLIGAIAACEQDAKRLNDALSQFPTKGLHERTIAAEANLEALQAERSEAERKLSDIKQRNRDLLDDTMVYSQLISATDAVTRAKLRQEIRRKVSSIEFDFTPARFPQPIGPINNSCRVLFVNGASRYLFFAKSGVYAFEKPAEFREDWSPEFKKI